MFPVVTILAAPDGTGLHKRFRFQLKLWLLRREFQPKLERSVRFQPTLCRDCRAIALPGAVFLLSTRLHPANHQRLVPSERLLPEHLRRVHVGLGLPQIEFLAKMPARCCHRDWLAIGAFDERDEVLLRHAERARVLDPGALLHARLKRGASRRLSPMERLYPARIGAISRAGLCSVRK
jgi:hypothetical protein